MRNGVHSGQHPSMFKLARRLHSIALRVPGKRSPSTRTKAAEFLSRPLAKAIKQFHCNIWLKDFSFLLDNLDYLSKNGGFSLGTACSGTEIVAMCFEMLSDYYRIFRCSTLPAVDHKFACVTVGFKREWIRHHFQPRYLYSDFMHFSDPKGMADDVFSCEKQPTPRVDIFVCGIECDSVSTFNMHQGQNRPVVRSGTDKTGSTAKAANDWVGTHRPFVVLFENVRNLHAEGPDGTSNLDVLMATMNLHGYAVRPMLLDAHPFGVPARRQRWYIVGARMGERPLTTDEEKDPLVMLEIETIVRRTTIGLMDLDDFVLPADHPDLVKQGTLEANAVMRSTAAVDRKKAKAEQAQLSARAGEVRGPARKWSRRSLGSRSTWRPLPLVASSGRLAWRLSLRARPTRGGGSRSWHGSPARCARRGRSASTTST